MQPISATDAISPAMTRTQHLLLKPFRWSRSWKLALVSYLGFCGCFFFPFPLLLAYVPASAYGAAHVPARAAVVLMVWCLFALYLAIFYVCVRMEMVLFQMTAAMETRIGPMWRRYGRRVWPWLGVKVVLGTLAFAVAARPLATTLRAWLAQMPEPGSTAPPDPAAMAHAMPMLFAFYGVFLAYFVALKLVDTVLHDFVLPVYLLEPVSLGTALRRGLGLFAENAGQSILYLFLKAVLSVAAYIGLQIATLISLIPIFLVFGVVVFLGVLLGHTLPPAAATGLLVVGGVVLYILFIAVILYVQIGLFGLVINFFESCGVWFVGSRYRPLGEMLTGDATTPYTPPPPTLPPSDEPPFPMDPAIA